MIKALFIYSGVDRRELEKKVLAGTDPDTSFFGYTHVAKDPRISVSYIQVNKDSYAFAGGIVRKYVWLRVMYLFFKYHRLFNNQDVILITSSAYFDLLRLRQLGAFKHQKLIILNLDLIISLSSHRFALSTINLADKIICVSEEQKDFLINKGIESHKVIFVPLGIDRNFYQVSKAQGEFILTVGRDIGRDFETFIEAVRLIGEKTVMVCSPKNIDGLEDKIPPNLTVLFDLPYQELKNYYKQAKVFVMATKPGESLVGSDCPGQTAVLDTLAYGVPVVATYMPWFRGYFEEGEEIVTVPPKDPKALSEAVKRVLADHVLATHMAEKGRKLIENKCNSETMGKAIAKIILEVVLTN